MNECPLHNEPYVVQCCHIGDDVLVLHDHGFGLNPGREYPDWCAIGPRDGMGVCDIPERLARQWFDIEWRRLIGLPEAAKA